MTKDSIPCVHEARSIDGVPSTGGVWCQTHGWFCPLTREANGGPVLQQARQWMEDYQRWVRGITNGFQPEPTRGEIDCKSNNAGNATTLTRLVKPWSVTDSHPTPL